MSILLVASDRPGAGKTATALALARVANRAGKTAFAGKPFPSRADDSDRWVFAELANAAPDAWPVRVGDSGPSVDEFVRIAPALAGAGANAQLTIVELPSYVAPDAAAVAAQALGAGVLLVAAYRRDLRGTHLTEWKASLGESLVGVLVNGLTRYLGTEAADHLIPSLDQSGFACLGVIPEDRFMLSVSVEQVREGLGGRYAVEEGDTERPLEWFQVGALSLDPGELRFGLYENNAAVVRGDRPDIQMSALNGSASCLVLTGGIDPIEYIIYEAREEETPVMVVEPDTLSTMTALNDVTAGARMDSAAKLNRFADLLEAHADLDRLWSLL